MAEKLPLGESDGRDHPNVVDSSDLKRNRAEEAQSAEDGQPNDSDITIAGYSPHLKRRRAAEELMEHETLDGSNGRDLLIEGECSYLKTLQDTSVMEGDLDAAESSDLPVELSDLEHCSDAQTLINPPDGSDGSNLPIVVQTAGDCGECSGPEVLGEDLVMEVLRRADARTLGAASCVSRAWRRMAEDERLWEAVCTRHWAAITGCGPAQLRVVVLALGGFRRLHALYLRPLLLQPAATARRRWGKDEIQLSLSLLSTGYFEKMNLGKPPYKPGPPPPPPPPAGAPGGL